MRVLLLHNRYKERGGEDVIFETDAHELSKRGHQIETIVFDNSSIQTHNHLQKIKAALQSFYSTEAYKKTTEVLQSFRPDVMHVHNFFYVASPSVFYAAKRFGVPTVMTLHNYRLVCANALLLRQNSICEDCVKKIFPFSGIQHKCFKDSALQTMQIVLNTSFHNVVGTWRNAVTHYIALTDFAKQKIVNSALQIPPHKITVKPNAVPDYGFSPPENRENFLLFVGRLSPEKGVETLLKMAQTTQVNIKIIGTGELAPQVIQLAQQNSRIQYLGTQPKQQVIEYLKKCKALLFPSIWYEGLPTVILEAFSTGTPVFARNINNLNQIVQNQYNGILFDNDHSLAEILRTFLPTLYYTQARNTYSSFYSFDTCYHSLERIYQKAVIV